MEKRELLYSGKAKSLYTTDEEGLLIADFRDDTTAFDGEKHEKLSDKGRVNQAISAFIMEHLSAAGIPTHFVRTLSDTESVVKKLSMLPIECVIRNVATGSLCRRLGVESGLTLSPPLFEFFLKNDELHDPLITADHAIAFGWATEAQLNIMRDYTFKINSVLSELFLTGDMRLVDAKFEFGLLGDQIVLGDEISPDSCRIWDVETNETLDKDRFRRAEGGVVEAYKQVMQRLGLSVVS